MHMHCGVRLVNTSLTMLTYCALCLHVRTCVPVCTSMHVCVMNVFYTHVQEGNEFLVEVSICLPVTQQTCS